MELTNKTVLVTGSSRGIGASLIEVLSKNKCSVIINYNNSLKEALELKNKIEKYSSSVLLIKCDITNTFEVKKMVKLIKDKYKKIDILINNAAISLDNDILHKTKEEFIKVLEVNVFGTFLVTKELFPYIKELVVNISSTDAEDTYNELSIDYSASKAAVNSLTKTLSKAIPNLKVIGIMLPWVNTDSIKEADPNYIKEELKRTNQKYLLEPAVAAEKIVNIIKSNNKTGYTYRIGE